MKTNPTKKIALILTLSIITIFTSTASGKPKTGAFYYPWFKDNFYHWENTKIQPTLGYYSSYDGAAMDEHFTKAQQAGLDFFLVSHFNGSSDEGAIQGMFDRAGAANIKLAILIEPDSDLKAIRDQYYISHSINYTQYVQQSANWFVARYNLIKNTYQWFDHPSYLHSANGRKILSFFHWDDEATISRILIKASQANPDIFNQTTLFYIGAQGTNPVTICSIFGQMGSFYALSNIGLTTYQPILEGGWQGTLNMYNNLANYYPFRPRIITVSPSFDNTGTGAQYISVIPRDNGERLTNQLNDIKNLSITPDYVIITSWNEWQEDSTIEPNVNQGDLYINIISSWVNSW